MTTMSGCPSDPMMTLVFYNSSMNMDDKNTYEQITQQIITKNMDIFYKSSKKLIMNY